MAWYATLDAVARELGHDLTGDELARADAWLGAATAWIDQQYAAVGMGLTTTVTNETQRVSGPYVYLDRAPILAISAITLRREWPGAASVALEPGTQYEVLDAARGLLILPGHLPNAQGGWLTVSYTTPALSTNSMALVERACCLLAAAWMQASDSDTAGIQAERFGDVQVTYRDAKAAPPVPPEVRELLATAMGGARLVFA